MRHNFLKILLVSSLLWPLLLWADESATAADIEILQVTDLQQLGRESLERNIPILLMLSADGCSWCRKLEEEFFKPMLRSGDYDDKAIIRQFKIDGSLPVRDFDGKMVSIGEINSRYRAFVTPTVIYLDGHGSELAKRMVGLTTSHYYGSYLDMAIDESLDMMRRDRPLKAQLVKLTPR